MSLLVKTFVLGPLENNTYLLADPIRQESVLIDPSFGAEKILPEIETMGLNLTSIWLTHAHFDHTAGVAAVLAAAQNSLKVGLHPLDLPLWQNGGGANLLGLKSEILADPQISFTDGQWLAIGKEKLQVFHTPGHTPGHVIFVSHTSGLAFCGDLIFYHSVGRTDLAGGDSHALYHSIDTCVLTLPDETRILSGHGPETTVAEERKSNPFL
jgi:hydroxyacylglutathione hydrolase